MKKTIINIPFDEEKLTAAKLYMEQKGLSFEDELVKAAETLYGQCVPANVREFIELRSESPRPSAKKTPRSSSAVGAASSQDGENS